MSDPKFRVKPEHYQVRLENKAYSDVRLGRGSKKNRDSGFFVVLFVCLPDPIF